MLHRSCKFGEPKWNPYRVIVLTSSSGTNFVPNKHEDNDQYDPCNTIQDNAMLKLHVSWKFGNQNEVPVDLSC